MKLSLHIAIVFGFASVNANSGCCTLDYRECIDWCGDSEEECINCSNSEVAWLPEGAPTDNCMNRWSDCSGNADGCCAGLTCQFENNYFGCYPGINIPTENPTSSPLASPTTSPTKSPTNPPVPSPTNPPNENGCCSQDYKTCVDWCGPTYDNCMNCGDVVWLPNGPLNEQCGHRWTGCNENNDSNHNGCCNGLSCQWRDGYGYMACLPDDSNPTDSPTGSPVIASSPPVPSPTNPPNENGCCSQDYKTCVDWCGLTYDNCMNCGDVVWLPNGPLNDEQCGERWVGCNENNDSNHNGCCDGLTCQWRDGYGYMACLPGEDDTTDNPTSSPTGSPTASPVVPFNGELLSSETAMNAWEVFKGLSKITQKNSENPPKYAYVASGGAAGGRGYVVSEGQAYGLLITGTILASWDTHAGQVSGANRAEVLTYFEGYYNFWKEMCMNSSSNSGCQAGGKFCQSGTDYYVCLPDWKHLSGGGSEATGSVPDGDADAIVGIILAVKAVENDSNKPSWYDEARKWADASATALFTFEVDKSKNNFALMKLGSCWGGWESNGNNPSYHSPGSYRVMKDYQNSFPSSDRVGYNVISQSDWTKLIETSYAVLAAVQCANDGALVPNWATIGVESGKIVHTGGTFSGSGTGQYEYGAEAARTTFRVALDAALYPEKSGEWSPYLSEYNYRLEQGYNSGSFASNTFPSCRGPDTFSDIYMFGDWQNNAFIYGPTYSALVGASPGVGQAMIDAAGKILGGSALPDSYYPRSWAMISNLMLNGAMESAGNTLKQ